MIGMIKRRPKQKKILIIHRYYWPDKSSCSSIIHSIASNYSSLGHKVDVLTSKPSYRGDTVKRIDIKDNINAKMQVFRIKLPHESQNKFIRISNAFKLGILTTIKCILGKYDIIIATSNPPIIVPFFSAFSSLIHRSRFIYFCMDINPEVGLIHGDFSNPLLYKILESFDNFSCKIAKPVLVHSNDMKNTLLKRRYSNKFNIEILNNFSVQENLINSDNRTSKDSNLNIYSNKLTIIYTGNIGRFQGLDIVIKAMGINKNIKDIELILVGEGVAKQGLEILARKLEANVRFLPYQPLRIVKRYIKQSDIALITLINGVYKYAYPSKTMTYLEQSKPVIAVIESDSEIAKDIIKNNYGYVVNQNNINQLANLFIDLRNSQSWRESKSKSAYESYASTYSSEVVLRKWSKLLDD